MKKTIKLLLILMLLTPAYAGEYDHLMDPTRPPDDLISDNVDATAAPLALDAIFTYPDHTVAIINGKELAVGDKIGDFSVSSITRNTVELVDADANKTILHLAPDIKRRDRQGN